MQELLLCRLCVLGFFVRPTGAGAKVSQSMWNPGGKPLWGFFGSVPEVVVEVGSSHGDFLGQAVLRPRIVAQVNVGFRKSWGKAEPGPPLQTG